MRKRSPWADLDAAQRLELYNRWKLSGEPILGLAQEIGMPVRTLERRLREVGQNLSEEQVIQENSGAPKRKHNNKLRQVVYAPVKLKACVFDLESADFLTGGWNSYLICCSILPLDAEQPFTLKLFFNENRNDRRLLKEVVAALSEYDILIGHNIAAHDLNWLYSRIMHLGLPQPKSQLYYDTYQVAKALAIKTESKGLGPLGAYFGVPGVKTQVFRTNWAYIASPDEEEFQEAMDAIVFHCEQDVLINRGIFDAIWLYDPKRTLRKTKW